MTDRGGWDPAYSSLPPPPVHNRPPPPGSGAPGSGPLGSGPFGSGPFGSGYPGSSSARTEPQATWSLILGIGSFVVLPLVAGVAAIVTGARAKQAIDASGGRLTGRRSAVVGEALGIVNVVVFPFVILALVISAASGGGTTHTPYTELRMGDCYNRISSHAVFGGQVNRVACTVAHDTEVTGTFVAAGGGTFPGTTGFRAQAQPQCTARARVYLESDRVTGLDIAWLVPDQATWNRGTHLVVCGVQNADGRRRTGSLRPR